MGFGRRSRWGGKFDMLAHLDSDKLGLWEGGTFDLFAESRLGQSVDGFAGTFSPTNLAMFFPVHDQQITAITGLKFTQAITERSGIFFGKLNALNGDPEKFLKYPLTSRFWNAAFNFNLALDRYPYSAPGAGFYAAPEWGPALAFLVLDSYNSPRTSGLENLGQNGVFLYAEAKQTTEFFGLPGRQVLAGLYGTGSFTDLSPASFVELPTGAAVGPLKAGTWTLLWNVEQRLRVDPDDPDRGLGLYVQTGLGDGNPNPVRWFLSAALCGNSPLPGREGDTFGVGFYDLGPSAQAKDLCRGSGTSMGSSSSTTCGSRPGATSRRTCRCSIRDWRPWRRAAVWRPPEGRFLTTEGATGWPGRKRPRCLGSGNLPEIEAFRPIRPTWSNALQGAVTSRVIEKGDRRGPQIVEQLETELLLPKVDNLANQGRGMGTREC